MGQRCGPDASAGPGSDGNIGGQVDGCGEYEAAVVVGVLADKVHAPRRAKQARVLAEALLKFRNQDGGQ